MADLVDATGASRAAIYSEFGGKDQLFIACLDAYREKIVNPAFARVEAEGAMLNAVRTYFEAQISRGVAKGLPGSGCLFANTMIELAPHDHLAMAKVREHNARLTAGFYQVLANENAAEARLSSSEIHALAVTMTTSTQGLWSLSRTVDDAAVLHRIVHTLISLVTDRVSK
ncbi:TetR/AcrR family transcriptional regulator [Burkholderia sp. PAMC 26561]|nr:TetR family transcriptional regulator [Burkholderia sp. PAMC 26561]